MTSFGRIQEINNQCMRNVEIIMNESKEQIKKFKIQQAEVMKNIMVSSEGNRELEQQFRNFQNNLTQREQEQYNQINGRIINEIENMKKLILQELSSPSIASNTSNFNMPQVEPATNNINASMGNMNSTMGMQNNNYSNDSMASANVSDSLDSQLLNEINGINSMPMSDNTVNNNNSNNSSNSSNYSSQPTNDIPVETKELDEWISEIKNLI